MVLCVDCVNRQLVAAVRPSWKRSARNLLHQVGHETHAFVDILTLIVDDVPSQEKAHSREENDVAHGLTISCAFCVT